MRVAHGDREGVGRIGRQRSLETQEHAHHVRHLKLLRAPGADHGQLDGAGRVLEHRNAAGNCAQRSPTRLPELERAVDVAADEDALNGDFGGPMLGQQRHQTLEDHAQSRRRRRSAHIQVSLCEQHELSIAALEHPEAGAS